MIVNFQNNTRFLTFLFVFLLIGIFSGNQGKRDFCFEDESGDILVIPFENNSLDCIDLDIEKESEEVKKFTPFSVSAKSWSSYFEGAFSYTRSNFNFPPQIHFVFTQIDLPPPNFF